MVCENLKKQWRRLLTWKPLQECWVLSSSSLADFCEDLWSEKGLSARDLYVLAGLLGFESWVWSAQGSCLSRTPTSVVKTQASYFCFHRNTGGAGTPGMEAEPQGRGGQLSAHFQGLRSSIWHRHQILCCLLVSVSPSLPQKTTCQQENG